MRTAFSLIVTLYAASAFAVDAKWDAVGNPLAGIWRWPANWSDLEGNVLAEPPTNATDTAYIACQTNKNLAVCFGYTYEDNRNKGTGIHYTMDIGRVYSDLMPTLLMGTRNSHGNVPPQMSVGVADPDDFKGFWETDNGSGEIRLTDATSSHTPALSHVDTHAYFYINVTNAGTKATVQSLYRNGALHKHGAGGLEIEKAAGWDSRIYCSNGSVILDGHPSAAQSIPSGAWLHLDASKTNTLETFAGNDGRTYISRWNDCDGGSVYAVTNVPSSSAAHIIPYSHAPYISPAKSPSGLPLVDFGVNYADTAAVAAGIPTNCWLDLSAECTSVREVFWAAKRSANTTHGLTLLGHKVDGSAPTYHFCGSVASQVFSGSSASSFFSPETSTLTFNGQIAANASMKKSRYGKDLNDFHVFSAASADPLTCRALATDRNYSSRTGGWVLGEIIVYDRELTADERRFVIDYLMAKWQKDCRTDDVGELVLTADSASVTVPEGRTARVKSLSTMGTKIVKKGGGELVVDGVSPSGTAIEVQGGSLRVATPEVTTNAPAADPYIWLDATKTASFVFSNDEQNVQTDYITRWNDCREGSTMYAEVPFTTCSGYYDDPQVAGNLPTVLPSDSPTGLPAVYFGGNRKKGDATCMCLSESGTAKSYAGFIALHVNVTGVGVNYFGTSSVDMMRNSTSMMLQQKWSTSRSVGAAWSFDGQPVDPWASKTSLYNNTNWHIVAVSAGENAMVIDLIAKYSKTQSGDMYVGNLTVGEMILYDRPISAEERRNTEAYLMNKWLGRPHPESAEGLNLRDVDFADGVDAVYDMAANVTVTNATVGNGTLVKRGSGTLTYSDLNSCSNITAISVEEGAAVVDLDIVDDADYRFDFSDTSKLADFYTTDDGNGGLVTNILEWVDSKRGLSAYSAHKDGFTTNNVGKYYATDSGSTCTNPTLKSVTMPDGSVKTVADFGVKLNVASLWKSGDDQYAPPPMANRKNSSGMVFANRANTTLYDKYREAHVISADNTSSRDGWLFSSWGSNPATQNTWSARGSNGTLFSAGLACVPGIRDGVIRLDGTNVAYNAVYPSGYHLVSIQPTQNVSVSSISMDRNCNSGGNSIGEYIAYKTAHSPEVFDYIQQSLMRKWFGTARPAWLTSFSSIRAATGTSLTLRTEAEVSAAELAGGGTIIAPEISGVSSLTIDGAVDGLTVNGKVTLAASGTITLTEASLNLEAGEYPLLTATELVAPAGIEDWSLVCDTTRSTRVSLTMRENSIVLVVRRPGIAISFK